MLRGENRDRPGGPQRARCGETMNVERGNGTQTLPAAHALHAWSDRIRLRRWAHLLPLPLATYDPHGPRADALLAAARGIASAFAILAFGYLLNSIADRRMDLDVRKNPFIVPGAGEPRQSLAGLVAVSLILAVFSPWPAQLATIACLTLGCVYSIGPRLKCLPIAGSLANVGGFTLLLFVGMRSTSLPPGFGYVVLAFAALLLQNQLIHEAADRVEDEAGGIRTTWLTLGPRWTALVVGLSGFGAAVAAACIVPPLRSGAAAVVAGAAFGLACPLLLVRWGTEPSHAARLRVAHRWCALLFGAVLFTVWRAGIA